MILFFVNNFIAENIKRIMQQIGLIIKVDIARLPIAKLSRLNITSFWINKVVNTVIRVIIDERLNVPTEVKISARETISNLFNPHLLLRFLPSI